MNWIYLLSQIFDIPWYLTEQIIIFQPFSYFDEPIPCWMSLQDVVKSGNNDPLWYERHVFLFIV